METPYLKKRLTNHEFFNQKFGIDKTYSISRREILNKKVTEIYLF
jgi:hypothetical protein